METQIQNISINGETLEALVILRGKTKDLRPDSYRIQEYVSVKIVDHLVNEFIKAHGVEVMKELNVSAIANLVSLKAAKVIKD